MLQEKGIVVKKALFFAFTFILNKQMNHSGSSWSWVASLRYIFMLTILYIILFFQQKVIRKFKRYY